MGDMLMVSENVFGMKFNSKFYYINSTQL